MGKGMGFNAAAKAATPPGEPASAGRAIIAAAARKASPAAKRANPNLMKVNGVTAPTPARHHRYTR